MQKQTVPLVQTGAAAGPDGAVRDAADHDVDAVALAGVAHPIGPHETVQGQVQLVPTIYKDQNVRLFKQ